MEVLLMIAVGALAWVLATTRSRLGRAEERASELRVELRSFQLRAEHELALQQRSIAELLAKQRASAEQAAIAAQAAITAPTTAIAAISDPAAVAGSPSAADPTPIAGFQAERAVPPAPSSVGAAPAVMPAVMPEAPAVQAPAEALAARVSTPVTGPSPVFASGQSAGHAEHDPLPDDWPAGDRAFQFVRDLLFGGNTVVRLGIFILLVGVALLLRWAAEHSMFPIELRMASAGAIAIGLVAVGFMQRSARPGFAFTLQGGGVATLYLVVFFSMKSYALIPPSLGFLLLAGIALFSGVLSVMQNTLSLLVIGEIGGFLAPVLASTGQGSHVALFSYYLLLNALVLAIAWHKPWRTPNLLGFLFTFGIATAWGALKYEPRHFATTEPFLIAFFLVYLAIPLIHALRHSDARRGLLEGGLVFGNPLVTLGLQWALVHDRPFGMALSTLALGTVYLGLGYVLHTRLREGAFERLRLLFESFVPIGAGFATLAIPYGFDNHNLTGATWALEGAGLYFIGVRQKRWLSRLSGGLLQLAAGVAILIASDAQVSERLPVLNTYVLASVLLGLGSAFVAQHAYRMREQLSEPEWWIAQGLIVWALGFVVAAGAGEIDRVLGSDYDPGAYVTFLALLALGCEYAASRLEWTPARYPGLLLWPLMFGTLMQYHELDRHPFVHAGYLGWPALALAMGLILKRFVDGDPPAPSWVRSAHPTALWLWVGFLALTAAQLTHNAAGLSHELSVAAGTTTLALGVLSVPALSRGSSWPFGVHPRLYANYGVLGLSLVLLVHVALATALEGEVAPLPYLPIVNPIDIAQLLGLLAVLSWLRATERLAPARLHPELRGAVIAALAGCAFIFWNGMLARAVHHYADVPWDAHDLWRSTQLQVAFSLSWTLLALATMLTANKKHLRLAWIVGASLLGVVVVKLFMLDLSRLSTPAKIVSFLGVGVLLLLIGYASPVPPARSTPTPAPNPEGGPT